MRRALVAIAVAASALALVGGAVVYGRRHAAVPSVSASASGSGQPSSSADESALIERAQAALAHHDLARARAALNEHAERFPDGQLKVQRQLLQAYVERSAEGKP